MVSLFIETNLKLEIIFIFKANSSGIANIQTKLVTAGAIY